MAIGQEFATKLEVQTTLTSVAMNRKCTFQFITMKSKRDVLLVIWMVGAAVVKESSNFIIMKYCNRHNCSMNDLTPEPQASAAVVASLVTATFGGGQLPTTGFIRDWMQCTHNTRITYWKAWMARQLAVTELRGSLEQS